MAGALPALALCGGHRTFRPVLLLVFLLSTAQAVDLGVAALTGGSAAAAALGLSFYRVPLMLARLPDEKVVFEVRPCAQEAKGRGLFARRPFASGEPVIEYCGDVLSWRGLAERYGSGTINLQGKYVFELRQMGMYIDAGDADCGCARFINHSGRRPNLEAQLDQLHSRVWFTAARDIAAGDELCFDYGERYWEGWPGEVLD